MLFLSLIFPDYAENEVEIFILRDIFYDKQFFKTVSSVKYVYIL